VPHGREPGHVQVGLQVEKSGVGRDRVHLVEAVPRPDVGPEPEPVASVKGDVAAMQQDVDRPDPGEDRRGGSSRYRPLVSC